MPERIAPISTTALIALACLAFDPGLSGPIGGGGIAWAQDDDNGGNSDDGGGGGFGNGGGSDDRSFFPQLTRRAGAPAAVPPPAAAPWEIVVSDLVEPSLATLTAEGFEVIAQRRLAALDRTITRLRVPEGLSIEQARDRVRTLPGGEDADLNHFYRSQSGEKPCSDENCADRQLVGWTFDTPCAVGLPIGVIDTGVNPQHEILAKARIELTRLAEPSPDTEPSAAVHGTAIVSLLVGDPDSRVPGLLPAAEVVAVDVFSKDGGDERADVPSLLVGLDHLHAGGVRVVNLSLAGPENGVLTEVLNALAAEDRLILVAAAGNGGPTAPPAWPAAHPAVLAVTAVDTRGRVYRAAQRGAHLDLAAPGVDLLAATSIRGARGKSGTSYAAPFVTAAAAAILSASPELAASEVRALLTATATDLGDAGADNIFGAGLLNATGVCGTDGSASE